MSKDPVPFYSIASVFDEAIALLSSAAGIRDSRKIIARELVPFRARAFILDRLMESRSCRKLIRDLFERPSWKVFWNGILQHWDDEVPFESRSLTVSNFLYNTLFTALFVVEVLIFLPVSLLVMYFRRLALGIGILTLANRVLGNDDLRSSPRSVERHAPGSGALTFPIEIDKKTEVALLRGAKPKDVDLFEILYSFGQSKIENVSDIYKASEDVERVFKSAQLVHNQYMSNDNIIGMIADCISKSRDATG